MWHGQFLLLPHIKPKTMPVSDMVAKHSDGEMIARTLVRFDMGLIRGAGAGEKGKDRGGAGALRAAVKALRQNITVAMTTDIPPGPARIAGMGIVTLARMSGRPIVPAAVATGRFFTLPTWSRLTINLPFTKLAMVVGDPIYVPRDADEETLEALRQKVEAGMNATTERAYKLAGSDAQQDRAEGRATAPALGISAYALPGRNLGGASGRDVDPAPARGARAKRFPHAFPSASALRARRAPRARSSGFMPPAWARPTRFSRSCTSLSGAAPRSTYCLRP